MRDIFVLVIIVPLQLWCAVIAISTSSCLLLQQFEGRKAKYCVACHGLRWPWNY